MKESVIANALHRHLEYTGKDIDISHEIYHDDAVLEFPQSQERFEGKENFIVWRKNYPASLQFKARQIRGRDNLWIAEISISYDGGPWNYGCSIMEFRDEKIIRETIYIGQEWDAPEWRAGWRSEW